MKMTKEQFHSWAGTL